MKVMLLMLITIYISKVPHKIIITVFVYTHNNKYALSFFYSSVGLF